MASREVLAIVAYLSGSGLPFRVTATTGTYVSSANPCAPHSKGSLHCAAGTGGKGLAVDFAGTQPGVNSLTVAQMGAIFTAFSFAASHLAELIYQGPGVNRAVKNGKWVDPVRVYGPVAWAAHRNHVHVAVPKGTFLRWPISPAPPSPPPAGPSYDYEEATIKTMLVHIGPLDDRGCGWGDWQVGLGRDPIIVGLVQLAPSPPDDGPTPQDPHRDPYWMNEARVNLAAQPRGGVLRVVVRGGTPGDTVSVWASVA